MKNYNIDEKHLETFRNNFAKKIENLVMSNEFKFTTDFQKHLIEVVINEIIKTDFELFMNYSKKFNEGVPNYRNGSHSRKLVTLCGEVDVNIPHDRAYAFFPECIEKKKEELLILVRLFKKCSQWDYQIKK